MEAIFNLIVTTGNRYNNTVDVEGNELIVNTEITERDAYYVNRIATVAAIPRINKSVIEVGDEVIIHHNVFRRWFDVRGDERNSGNYIDEGVYSVYFDQVYAYRKPGEDWKALPGYTFVAPIKERQHEWDTNDELIHVGIMKYGPEELVGTTVGFTPNSEYEFQIGDQLLYRIYLNDITWTSKKNAKELLSRPQ